MSNDTESQAVILAELPPQGPTPAQAKDKAVADLTADCYKQASQLKLSPEEIKALSADFPDEAFQPGAAGKDNLIYIEHAALRERLDLVIGMGQWCIIPIRRWVEEFTYEKEKWANNRRTGEFEQVKGSHVYVDGIMLIRGAFVASAIGEMTYYPDNHVQNYGDAVEGAETAALRRCCKRLGIGLQAWRKDWCLGWWKRKNAPGRAVGTKPSQDTPPAKKTPPSPSGERTGATPETSGKAFNVEKTRMRTLNLLKAAPGQENRKLVTDYLDAQGWISGEQLAEDWPAEHLPKSKEALDALSEDIQKFEALRREQDLQEELPQ